MTRVTPAADGRTRLLDMNLAELRDFFSSIGEPAYRASQLFDWVYGHLVDDFERMTTFPVELRTRLKEVATVAFPPVLARQESRDGTVKFLLDFGDRQAVETVLMKYEYGYTVCASTQAGCLMGCTFCASTIGGKARDLRPGEMIGQVLVASRELRPRGERVRGVVLMGSGEPLENYDHCLKFIRMLHEPKAFGIGYRHITLSTCGLVPEIDRLAGEGLPITLAVSLHAPDDETRSQIMPINRKYRVRQLLDACRRYEAETGRRLTFEYIMIDGVNDTPEHARRLVREIAGINCHVNLIPANPVPERGMERSTAEAVAEFQRIVSRAGIDCTVRRELGTDIDAACGQLRRKFLDAPAEPVVVSPDLELIVSLGHGEPGAGGTV